MPERDPYIILSPEMDQEAQGVGQELEDTAATLSPERLRLSLGLRGVHLPSLSFCAPLHTFECIPQL